MASGAAAPYILPEPPPFGGANGAGRMAKSPENSASAPFRLAARHWRPLIFACLTVLTPPARAQAGGPFDGLSGAWAGTGVVTLSNGAVERLRCAANYDLSGGGDTLEQDLRCASGNDSFDFRIQLSAQSGAIVGNWSELTRKVQGGISGRASNGNIQVTVRGQAFSADVTVATRGARQSVTISGQGGGLSAASIVLRHGG